MGYIISVALHIILNVIVHIIMTIYVSILTVTVKEIQLVILLI